MHFVERRREKTHYFQELFFVCFCQRKFSILKTKFLYGCNSLYFLNVEGFVRMKMLIKKLFIALIMRCEARIWNSMQLFYSQ